MFSRRIAIPAAFALGTLAGLGMGALGLGTSEPVETKTVFEDELSLEEVGDGRVVISSQVHDLLITRDPNPSSPVTGLPGFDILPQGDRRPYPKGQGGFKIFKIVPLGDCPRPEDCIPCRHPRAQCGIVEIPGSGAGQVSRCDCEEVCAGEARACLLPLEGCNCS